MHLDRILRPRRDRCRAGTAIWHRACSQIHYHRWPCPSISSGFSSSSGLTDLLVGSPLPHAIAIAIFGRTLTTSPSYKVRSPSDSTSGQHACSHRPACVHAPYPPTSRTSRPLVSLELRSARGLSLLSPPASRVPCARQWATLSPMTSTRSCAPPTSSASLRGITPKRESASQAYRGVCRRVVQQGTKRLAAHHFRRRGRVSRCPLRTRKTWTSRASLSTIACVG